MQTQLHTLHHLLDQGKEVHCRIVKGELVWQSLSLQSAGARYELLALKEPLGQQGRQVRVFYFGNFGYSVKSVVFFGNLSLVLLFQF